MTCILPAFSPARQGFFPCGMVLVFLFFFCRLPAEQVLYYRHLGLYYRLVSTTLDLYAKPCAKVKGGCLSCEGGAQERTHELSARGGGVSKQEEGRLGLERKKKHPTLGQQLEVPDVKSQHNPGMMWGQAGYCICRTIARSV